MNILNLQVILGTILGVLVALAAYQARSLNASGAFGAALLGAIVFGLGGLSWAVLLLGFFISSSALSRLFGKRKARFEEKFSKGSRRDLAQVMANGGIAGGCVLLHALYPAASGPWLAFAGALAAANADTWATELGVLSRTQPRLITNGQPVEPGTSGGISLWGTCCALLGGLFIAALAVLAWPGGGAPTAAVLPALLGISLAGLLGSLLDSLLGATAQAIYTCPACGKETERHPTHTCGTATLPLRGLAWMNNDAVNSACTLLGAVIGLGIALLPVSWYAGAPVSLTQSPPARMVFSSPAAGSGQPLAARHTCQGEGISPELTWEAAPAGTRSLALIVEDPDAPLGNFTHWVLYNLPPDARRLPENAAGMGTVGRNSFGTRSYTAPCPPPGPAHRYYFYLYALDFAPTLPDGLSRTQLRSSLQGHILAAGEWMGTFQQ